MPVDSTDSFQRLLDQQQAATYLGVQAKTLESWRVRPPRGGAPVYCKIGALVRYDKCDLDSWIDAHKRTSTSQLGGVTQ